MSGPNVFLPSDLVTPLTMVSAEASVSQDDDGALSLRIKAAPFLERNIVRDIYRRDYVIAPGGRSYLIAGKPVPGE